MSQPLIFGFELINNLLFEDLIRVKIFDLEVQTRELIHIHKLMFIGGHLVIQKCGVLINFLQLLLMLCFNSVDLLIDISLLLIQIFVLCFHGFNDTVLSLDLGLQLVQSHLQLLKLILVVTVQCLKLSHFVLSIAQFLFETIEFHSQLNDQTFPIFQFSNAYFMTGSNLVSLAFHLAQFHSVLLNCPVKFIYQILFPVQLFSQTTNFFLSTEPEFVGVLIGLFDLGFTPNLGVCHSLFEVLPFFLQHSLEHREFRFQFLLFEFQLLNI